MKHALLAIIAAALFQPVLARAGERHDMVLAQAASTNSAMSDGEIRKIDKEAKKLTIRHGPMPQLDMPSPMTMVYRVKDPAMLDQVKPGDKVKFQAEKIDGAFTVTKIEPAQ